MSKVGGGFESRLAAYGSMSLALAAVAMPAAAGTIQTYAADITAGSATPVYFDPANGYAGFNSAPGDFELLVQNFASSIFRDSILISPGNVADNGNRFVLSASSLVAKLAPGSTVGAALQFGNFGTLAGNAGSDAGAHWNSLPAEGDLGLSQECGVSGTCYGWANITVNPDYTITLNSFGYDSSGNPILAGVATPEPASIILLAIGAAGIGAWRRKNKAAR
jgi:hypothetical protein